GSVPTPRRTPGHRRHRRQPHRPAIPRSRLPARPALSRTDLPGKPRRPCSLSTTPFAPRTRHHTAQPSTRCSRDRRPGVRLHHPRPRRRPPGPPNPGVDQPHPGRTTLKHPRPAGLPPPPGTCAPPPGRLHRTEQRRRPGRPAARPPPGRRHPGRPRPHRRHHHLRRTTPAPGPGGHPHRNHALGQRTHRSHGPTPGRCLPPHRPGPPIDHTLSRRGVKTTHKQGPGKIPRPLPHTTNRSQQHGQLAPLGHQPAPAVPDLHVLLVQITGHMLGEHPAGQPPRSRTSTHMHTQLHRDGAELTDLQHRRGSQIHHRNQRNTVGITPVGKTHPVLGVGTTVLVAVQPPRTAG